MLALVDLGSSTTVCNWAAARTAGFRQEGDARVEVTDEVVAGASFSISRAQLFLEHSQVMTQPCMRQVQVRKPSTPKRLRCGTANVKTLLFAGRRGHIAKMAAQECVHILGVQEARTAGPDVTCSEGYVMLSSGVKDKGF